MSKFGTITISDNAKIEWLLQSIADKLMQLKSGAYGELLVQTGNQATSTVYNYQQSNTTSTNSQLMLNENPLRTLMAWQNQALNITYA